MAAVAAHSSWPHVPVSATPQMERAIVPLVHVRAQPVLPFVSFAHTALCVQAMSACLRVHTVRGLRLNETTAWTVGARQMASELDTLILTTHRFLHQSWHEFVEHRDEQPFDVQRVIVLGGMNSMDVQSRALMERLVDNFRFESQLDGGWSPYVGVMFVSYGIVDAKSAFSKRLCGETSTAMDRNVGPQHLKQELGMADRYNNRVSVYVNICETK